MQLVNTQHPQILDAAVENLISRDVCARRTCALAPIPVASRSEAWIYGRSLAGIAGSNLAGGMDVCLLRLLCVVRCRSLRRADHPSRGALPSVVCNLEDLTHHRRCTIYKRAVVSFINFRL